MRKSIRAYSLALTLALCLQPMTQAAAETLRFGMKGEEVRTLQEALIDQKYLSGKADGIFGSATEQAVLSFQKDHQLTEDGLAGSKTQSKLYGKQKSGLFSGDYSTIRETSDTDRIRLLQQTLISMNYLKTTVDGEYGSATRAAVKTFQRSQKLREDGLAGKKTLKALEKAAASGHRYESALDRAEALPDSAGKMDAPAKSSIELLHWYNDVKPSLKATSKLTVYDPDSRLGWTVKIHSRGRHCDVEPATLQDTQIMLKAFDGKHTWKQKGVYVRLPDGRWTVGSTHSMPHLSSYVRDNGLDGHVCIHFFRDMDECMEQDPAYGANNQRTIRTLWKKVSGETVT